MSAIIAGRKCRNCGSQYFTSLGHPFWFDNGVRNEIHGIEEEPKSKYTSFEKIRRSGYCLPCIAVHKGGKKLFKHLKNLMSK
jgi:rubredoxin